MRLIAPTVLVVVALLPAAAQAQQTTEECKEIANLAEVVMTTRQSGVDLSTMIDVAIKNKSELLRDLALAAFETPRFETPSLKSRAISEFRSTFELACYKGLNIRGKL